MKKTLILALSMIAMVANAQYQLPNPGFEQWDGDNTSEPTHWNTFSSSDGTWASLASSNHHYRRNGGRPGSAGSHFLTIYTKSIVGVKANGNMTTGRIHAGSTSASSSENYNYTQRGNSNHCQPFTGTPDSMYVWVSYYAESGSSEAQISAILHGDNDFRAPNHENDASLYCGKAVAQFTRTTSSSSSYQWQLKKIPFVYSGSSTANYMLVSLTTNRLAGSGATNDSLSIDDIEFIYSAWLNAITVGGNAVEGFEKGRFDYAVAVSDSAALDTLEVVATTEVDDATVSVVRQRLDDTTAVVTLTVTAEDGTTVRTYTVTLVLTSGDVPVAIENGTSVPTVATVVYPNPTTDIITVEADGEVTLVDLEGRMLLRRQVVGKGIVDMQRMPAGTYLLKCGNTVRRIVKL